MAAQEARICALLQSARSTALDNDKGALRSQDIEHAESTFQLDDESERSAPESAASDEWTRAQLTTIVLAYRSQSHLPLMQTFVPMSQQRTQKIINDAPTARLDVNVDGHTRRQISWMAIDVDHWSIQ